LISSPVLILSDFSSLYLFYTSLPPYFSENESTLLLPFGRVVRGEGLATFHITPVIDRYDNDVRPVTEEVSIAPHDGEIWLIEIIWRQP
jgi:hypothetical protein